MAELRSKKQEAFVQLVVQGTPQIDAFRAVYKNKMTDKQVYEEASAMINGTGKYAKNPKIHQRYLELHEKAQAEAEEKTIAKSAEMQQKLTAIIRQLLEEAVIIIDPINGATKMKKTASIKDIISAINTLGKMQGLFTDNVNINGGVGVVIVDDIENS